MADLRKDKRAPASLKVKYKSATVDEFIEQFGIDVSSGGIFVKTKKPIETGALLKLELQLNDASPVIHGVGRVCWRREAGPDPSLPAGMGIKFIKLDPGSRTIVDRIVQARGRRPSRFDQTEGAEIAAPSVPPDADVTPPPGPLRPPSAVRPAADKAAAPLAPPRPAAAPRAPSPGASAVAGLFADSPLARDSSPEPTPPGGKRSSFFPPPIEDARPGPAEPPRAQRVPPPAAFGSAAKSAGARAEHTRQSGEFLAAALAAGGVAEPASAPTAPPAKPAKPGEDELIDQLFADVMSSGRTSNAPGGARAGDDPGSVDDVFAALGEEEGLAGSGGRGARGAAPAHAAERAPAVRSGAPGRAGVSADEVDELFGELNHVPARPGRASPAPAPRAAAPKVAPPPEADSFEAEWDGPTNDLEETDLAGASLPPSVLPSVPSEAEPSAPLALDLDLGAASAAPAARSRSPLVWIVPLLIAAAGGGYFYYQRQLEQQRMSAEPRALERDSAPAPAVAPPATLAGGAAALAGAEAQAAAAGAAANDNARQPGEREPAAAAAEAPAKPTGGRVEIEITSLPRGASVQIDGRTVGVSPLHASLPSGKPAQVTVSSEGYATMTRQVVPGADDEPLRFKLEPLPFELRVLTIPPDAELAVGTVTAIAPGPLALGHLDGGVQVSVGKPGYQRMTRPVRLDEFREQGGVMRAEIEVRLSPLPGGAVEPPPLSAPQRHRLPRKRSGAPAPPEPPEPPATLVPPSSAAPPPPAPPPAPPPGAPLPDQRPEAVAPVGNE